MAESQDIFSEQYMDGRPLQEFSSRPASQPQFESCSYQQEETQQPPPDRIPLATSESPKLPSQVESSLIDEYPLPLPPAHFTPPPPTLSPHAAQALFDSLLEVGQITDQTNEICAQLLQNHQLINGLKDHNMRECDENCRNGMYIYLRTPRGKPHALELVVAVNTPNMSEPYITQAMRKKGMKFAGRKYPVKNFKHVEYTHGKSEGLIARKYNFVDPVKRRQQELAQEEARLLKQQQVEEMHHNYANSGSATGGYATSSISFQPPMASNAFQQAYPAFQSSEPKYKVSTAKGGTCAASLGNQDLLEKRLIEDIEKNILCGLEKRKKLKLLKEIQAELEEEERQKNKVMQQSSDEHAARVLASLLPSSLPSPRHEMVPYEQHYSSLAPGRLDPASVHYEHDSNEGEYESDDADDESGVV